VAKINSNCYSGRLVKDAEVKMIGNADKKWETIYFTIAVQDDSDYKKVDFINCQGSPKDIKYLKLYGKKGAWIEFSGRTKSYVKDGDTKQVAVANKVNIIFANSKKETTEEETEKPVF